MMEASAGHRADATKVANILNDRYRNPAKDAIRSWVISEIKATNPSLVLDLHSGGLSAAEMTAAGLSVLSVDDGRDAATQEPPISRARFRRAMMIRAEAGGYRAEWGSAAKYAGECDAAWLDFMGHLCKETIRTLKQCRRMKALAITLMPERMAGVEGLSVDTWASMYRAAIELHSGLSVRAERRYRREGGQWVLVMLANRSLSISPRERQVGILIADGLSNIETGERLGITRSTVDSIRQRLYSKIGVDNAVNLTHYAIDHDWIKVKGGAEGA